jgi:hypothetical protein
MSYLVGALTGLVIIAVIVAVFILASFIPEDEE